MEQTSPEPVCPSCGWDAQAAAASVLHLRPATLLHERYVIGRVLGQGGFGITYLAWDSVEKRKVAVKEYFPQAIASRSPGASQAISVSERVREHFNYGLQRFIEEAGVLALFREHPCVVSVFDLLQAEGTGYLVMEYLEGMTLRDYLAGKGQRLPYDLTSKIMQPVMDALRDVHAHRVLHRDVSPDNILLTTSKKVKLIDFGAARFAVSERSQSLSVILKPGYAPEEQYRQRGQQGPWTDVYATAATIYRCVTGAPPPEALDRMAEETFRSPRELGFNIPAHADDALRRALAIRANERFSSMLDFQTALRGKQGPSYSSGEALAKPDRSFQTPSIPPECKAASEYPEARTRSVQSSAAQSSRPRISSKTGFGLAAVVVTLAVVSAQVYVQQQTKFQERLAPPPLTVPTDKNGTDGDQAGWNRIGRKPPAAVAKQARAARPARSQVRTGQDRIARIQPAAQEPATREAPPTKPPQPQSQAQMAAERQQAALNPDWRLFADDSYMGTNKIHESGGYLKIAPTQTNAIEADLPIKTSKNGKQEIMGPWQNTVKLSGGFLVIQQRTEQRITGYMFVPMPWVSDGNTCMNRTIAFLADLADDMAKRQSRCQRINVVWLRP